MNSLNISNIYTKEGKFIEDFALARSSDDVNQEIYLYNERSKD